MSETLTVTSARRLHGAVRVPSDKSITHRAYLFAAMAMPGVPSIIREPLTGEDCENTREILNEIGAEAEYFPAGTMGEVNMTVIQPPPHDFVSPEIALDCGNSGTTMRLLAGILAPVKGFRGTLVGDASLSRRPMKRVIEPLRTMGANIQGETAPLTINGSDLKGIEYTSPVASAQVKTCVLLAGLRASGETWIMEPTLSRDHTERMLDGLGVEVMHEGSRIGVVGGQKWGPLEITVPADISSAAFWMVAACCVPNSEIVLDQVGLNPTRTGVMDVLESANADISIGAMVSEAGEPTGTVFVRGGRDLKSFEIGGSLVPRLVDEIPVLAVLATQCQGKTVIRDAGELRVKESDRIKVVVDGLAAMGATIKETDDGMEVSGPTRLRGATIDAEGDHRIGMAFAIAGLIAGGTTTILNADSIATSYPNFTEDMKRLCGGRI
ncbi:MAG: 3-phosphoshikimate 1-carboxyvinyltransferase [Fimbriimonadaceae bacterium]|nr:3-phosphoshikimate 1-carboxyvinyltransferase [Fimbriimonadaceae bacterium]